MDAFLPALISALPQLGGAGVILVVLVLLLRSSSTDRADYRVELKAAAERHTDEIKRINADHDAEMAEVKAEVRDLRKKLIELQLAVDVEREGRRKAEDMAAEALRRKRGPA